MVNRIGEVSYNSKNEKMTIIAYRKYDDIDIQLAKPVNIIIVPIFVFVVKVSEIIVVN